MLREAELFVMAEQMLVEVLGRIRVPDRDIVLPAIVGTAEPLSIRKVVEQYVEEDGLVPSVLAGPAASRGEQARNGDGIADVAAASCAAARQVVDGDALVHSPKGALTAREYLLRQTVARSLLAHYVAAYLGSTACPLPEELARPLWELTGPEAATWRALGYFREPMPLPDHVSWRDRFLLTAGHEPHPLGH